MEKKRKTKTKEDQRKATRKRKALGFRPPNLRYIEREKYERAQKSSSSPGVKTKPREKNTEHIHTHTDNTYYCIKPILL